MNVKYLLLSAMFVIGSGFALSAANNAFDSEFDVAEQTELITISAAGNYLIFSDDATTELRTTGIYVAEGIVGDVNITLRDVNLYPKSALQKGGLIIGSGSLVNLTLEGVNRLRGSDGCGIQTIGDVVIGGSGELKAYGNGGRAAGIGQLSSSAMGDITINSGTIYAESSSEASGIGGGNGGTVGIITINGGNITAKGGYYASGIGGGYVCKNGQVIINGGTISARAGTYNTTNNGIGAGHGHSGMTVTVTGGSIYTLNNSGAFKENGFNPAPKNAGGDAVELFAYQVSGVDSPMLVNSGSIGSIVLGTDYGINSTYTDADGNLYFYLPPQDPAVSVVINNLVSGTVSPKEDNGFSSKVFSTSNNIIIENGVGQKVQILDVTGRTIVSKRIDNVSEVISMPGSGVFFVKLENNKAAKVLVR